MAIVIGSTTAGSIATITLGDLKTVIQGHGYGTDTSAIQSMFIRQALRRMYGVRRWRFLAISSTAFNATVANTGIVDISTLGRGIMLDTVRIGFGTDFRDMEHVDDNELSRERYIDRELGFPRRWTRIVDSLVLYPRPNATYPLEVYAQALTTLPTADGDTIIWPETHTDVIVYSVVMALARRQRDWAGYDRAKQDLADAMVELMRDEEFDNTQTDLEVEHWDGWGKGGVPLP